VCQFLRFGQLAKTTIFDHFTKIVNFGGAGVPVIHCILQFFTVFGGNWRTRAPKIHDFRENGQKSSFSRKWRILTIFGQNQACPKHGFLKRPCCVNFEILVIF